MNVRWTIPPAAAAALLLLAAGCGTGGADNAGLTNGPPPAGTEKPAMRTDLPDAAAPAQGELLGRTGDASTDGGTAARGGGNQGARPELPDLPHADESVRATPPTVEASGANSAAGGTRPAENINTGTPRSPQ